MSFQLNFNKKMSKCVRMVLKHPDKSDLIWIYTVFNRVHTWFHTVFKNFIYITAKQGLNKVICSLGQVKFSLD